MQTSSKTLPLLFSLFALACQEKATPKVTIVKPDIKPVVSTQSVPAKTPTSIAQGAAVPNPVSQPASTPASKPFVDPLPSWNAFLTDRLGGKPESSLIGDFNGDGVT